MEEFKDFEEWCRYWGNSFNEHHNTTWAEILNYGIESHDESKQYLFRVAFDSEADEAAARNDLYEYWDGHGWGEVYDTVDFVEDSQMWNVFLVCPEVPLVIRIANNHGGHIGAWNEELLKCPPKHIPFYIPSKPKQKQQPKESGCYIATAVYGSYDCPEVWTLRRYRDDVLDNSWYGRLFIRAYYAVSPRLVKWFGTAKWFRNLFYNPLNRWVRKLNERGFKNTPYEDKY